LRTIVKRPVGITVVFVVIFTLLSQIEVAESGPFSDFFRALRSSIAHPVQKSRSHRSNRKEHNETPPSDASNSQTTVHQVAGPPDGNNVRVAKATSITKQEQSDVPYGTPVPGKQGLVTSPFSPDRGYIDVRGFAPGTPVRDPYTGKIFLTP
jgi:hypothetical protein